MAQDNIAWLQVLPYHHVSTLDLKDDLAMPTVTKYQVYRQQLS